MVDFIDENHLCVVVNHDKLRLNAVYIRPSTLIAKRTCVNLFFIWASSSGEHVI